MEKVVGSRGGSTAATTILINGEKLIVANVGDSRAVLCRDGVAKQITVDHNPATEKEKDLVESRGGFVLKGPGTCSAFFYTWKLWLVQRMVKKLSIGHREILICFST